MLYGRESCYRFNFKNMQQSINIKTLDFIKKVVRIRQLLIKQNKGYLEADILSKFNSLADCLPQVPYYDKERVKCLFIIWQDVIFNVIPSKKCKSHKKLINEFNEIKNNL